MDPGRLCFSINKSSASDLGLVRGGGSSLNQPFVLLGHYAVRDQSFYTTICVQTSHPFCPTREYCVKLL